MSLQTGGALWWLLPAGGVIILLYLLKMRRLDVRVPATFLWPKITADVRANAPFQRLRVSLLLILQLLIVALIVFALANPLRKAHGLHGRATVVVLDASTSMSATDIAPTRFAAAVKRVSAIVDTMQSGDQLAVIEAGPTTRVVFPLTNDHPRMAATLRDLHPTDAPNDMGEALRLAAALVGRRPEGRIVVLTDGTFPQVADFSPGRAELVYERFGRSSANVAVTAFDTAATAGGTQLFAGIRNEDANPHQTTVSFLIDGTVADAREITVPPHQTVGQTFKVPVAGRHADVRIVTAGDILPSDDHAALFLHGAGGTRTLLVSNGDLFLERALSLEPGIQLDKAGSVPDTERAGTSGDGAYDLVVFDGLPAEPVKAPAVLAFGGFGEGMPAADGGPSERPRVIEADADHPVMRHVDADGTLIEKAHRLQSGPDAHTLLNGSDGPLIVASQTGGRRAIQTAWSLLDSDFPLRVSFPIFVGNAVAWLTGAGRTTGGGIAVRTGQPFAVSVPDKLTNVSLHGPDVSASIDAASGSAVVRGTDVAGDYTLTGRGYKSEVVANVLSESESDVAPRSALDLAGRSVGENANISVLAETWRPLVLFALIVMAVEWWVFVKRS